MGKTKIAFSLALAIALALLEMPASLVIIAVFIALLFFRDEKKVVAFDFGGVFATGEYFTEEIKERKGMRELIGKVRKNNKVVLLTNDNAETQKVFSKKFGLDRLFDDIIVSGAVGLKKPDKRIFGYLANRTKTSPKNIVFIDDQQENLEPAKELGIRTILFQSVGELEKKLAGYGVP